MEIQRFSQHFQAFPGISRLFSEAIAELKIDPVQDEQLLWIAEHAMKVELPPDWVEFEDDDGNQAYYHARTKRLTTEHPVIFKRPDIEG